MTAACSIHVRGVVQGVGFRPFVFRLAHANTLAGWVLNAGDGVEIHVEGAEDRVDTFLRELRLEAPAAATISAIDIASADLVGVPDFTIRESDRRAKPTVRISPDLATCDACLRELFDHDDSRFHYPYINCTDCGPRYSIVRELPYDRDSTTMQPWPMDARCEREYHDPRSRRFHAQPIACSDCGPTYTLSTETSSVRGADAIAGTARLLREGGIVAIKGIGGYHLACDARNAATVLSLRERKYRKEKPFALMVRDIDAARRLTAVDAQAARLLMSTARPIVLVPGAAVDLPGVAPDNDEIGIMLAYAPLHHLLFDAGAPDVLVMTSANRSNEPIAYRDADAIDHLTGIADALLIGERPIARRVEDSVVRPSATGPVVLRRSRGYAPGAVAEMPIDRPILALGADLKSAITLVVGGQAFVSQHIGDLEQYEALRAFDETVDDLLTMYEVSREDLIVARDAHPQYRSSLRADRIAASEQRVVQHHRAHVASVIAERGAWDKRVLGISYDGTGYGDDGSIWGGELFAGRLVSGFERVAHLRASKLAGGDAAARFPAQAAAGFLAQLDGIPALEFPPFAFPSRRYREAVRLLDGNIRTFATTSMGRLFDAAAALVGFTREVTFEGQAAMWLEHTARRASSNVTAYEFPFDGRTLDFRPLLAAIVRDRLLGRDPGAIARAFHAGMARGTCEAAVALCGARGIDTVVLSGGVFQNVLLLDELSRLLGANGLDVWTNHAVPPNDGGVSLGQAALAAFDRSTCTSSPSR